MKIEDVKLLKEIKSITSHTLYVSSLFLLKDKRIASCSYDKTIRIYNPSNDYHCEQVLQSSARKSCHYIFNFYIMIIYS